MFGDTIDSPIFGGTRAHSNEGYEIFVESVLANECAVYQLSDNLFIVNGWDPRSKMSTAAWYHLQAESVGVELNVVCLCPQAKTDNLRCYHTRFVREYQNERFPSNGTFAPECEDLPILFSRQQALDGSETGFLNHFSVPSPRQCSLKSRAVVSFEGNDLGDGVWICNCKDTAKNCAHINACRHALQQYVNADPGARDSRVESEAPLEYNRKHRNTSVSHLEIPPPHWAAIRGDRYFGPPIPPMHTEPPAIIHLTSTSSCCCSSPRYLYHPNEPTRQQPCTIYGITGSLSTTVEIQACGLCTRRFVGPDCRELGLFNFNNRIMFTHDVLNDYTSTYTASETPFASWVTIISRRYAVHESSTPFVSEQMFRTVWFAYVKLQCYENDMTCPECGPHPENTIWDGVTLAFNRKHLLSSLQPPTTIHEQAVSRDKTCYITGQQLIPDSKLRKVVRRIIVGKALALSTEESNKGDEGEEEEEGEGEGEDEDDDDESKIIDKAYQERMKRAELIPPTCMQLTQINRGLGDIFTTHFGMGPLLDGVVPNEVYKRLFLQIVAEESVLQMAIRSALDLLDIFTQNPTTTNASALVNIPTLRDVLKYEFRRYQRASASMIDVCEWIVQRGRAVLTKLIVSPAPERDNGMLENDTRWETTGCCYGMPQIRFRPKYPRLKHDVRGDVGGKRGAKCSKFYSKYGEQRLTGGIMCVWCTHSVCYGFHCIPRGEGRNDVFSAIITRWPKPPKRVIYDFACALGPYCMTREPEFFADTLFLIDDFHSKDHTKCSEAAFLKTYCNVDATLSGINSSAGECGNSGITRIRKSVSYMSQDRAIMYTKIFLSIWNRLRIRKIHAVTVE
ncbi:hypothetical protein BD779DRAFT_1453446 [Infundibulicybe gibba]|nr:hypothetical protein BD779DRAFT_1453446 [Infundibulicybe gibba]